MRRDQRLRLRRDFAAITARGRSVNGRSLTLRIVGNGLEQTRFGFAVGKRVGNAVTRNTVKRRLRAALAALSVAPGHDILVIARASASTLDYHELQAEVNDLLRRAKARSIDAPLSRSVDADTGNA